MRFHKLEEALIDLSAIFGGSWEGGPATAAASMLMNLRSSQKFYCGDLWSLPRMKNYVDFPRLPFPIVAFEYIDEGYSKMEGGNAFFCLAKEDCGRSGRLRLICNFFIYLPNVASGPRLIGQSKLIYGEEAATVQLPMLIDDAMDRAAGERVIANHTLCIGDFLSVVNCVNVAAAVVEPSAALNKKREKNGKPPLYSYKTLVLKSAVARRAWMGGTHESPRIHLCRGHIKRRKTGNFWWQPHVRGDRARGVVMKDYRADELIAGC